jgi:hypothetical protein
VVRPLVKLRSEVLPAAAVNAFFHRDCRGRALQFGHGFVTNGDHWMLVNAPKNETTGYASWYANLWLEEKDTLGLSASDGV